MRRYCEFSDSCKEEVFGFCENHRNFGERKSGLFLAVVWDHLDQAGRLEGTIVEFDSLLLRDAFVKENPGIGFGQMACINNPF